MEGIYLVKSFICYMNMERNHFENSNAFNYI